jgi:hypothetical protein
MNRVSRSDFVSLVLPLIVAAAALAAPHAAGQAAKTATQPPPAAPSKAVDPSLEPNPLVVETLNLTFHPPRGASTVAQVLNGQPVVDLRDNPDEPTWTMRVQAMKSTVAENPSPKAQVDDLLADLTRAKREYKVLLNEPRTVSGLQGHVCFLDRVTPDAEPEKRERFISGWLVLPIASDEFMVFAVQTLPEHFAAMKPVFEACFNTIALRSRDEVRSEQLRRLENGLTVLKSLTRENLHQLVGSKQWTRIYKPPTAAGQPSEEVGCALIEVLEAKRGALNPERNESKFSADERKEGLMVRVQGRYIQDAQRRVFYDSIALYWLAWDQSEEAWSVRATQRQGDAEKSEAETGVRIAPSTGQPVATLSVIKQTSDGQPVPNEWEVPEVYLSQALHWIIGRLLPRDITSPQEYAWYFYVPSSMQPKMYQRLDRWEPGGDGHFTLTTYLTPDAPPLTSVYARDGAFIRRTHTDGSITEPVELAELRRIWKSKGIPVSANER